MDITKYINGFQHVALPTRNMEITKEFYKKLGFTIMWEKENCPVYFQQKDIVIESWEDNAAIMADGAWLHLSIDVSDIYAVHGWLKENGYNIITGKESPKHDKFLTDKGVACVMVEGPNHDIIEFNQVFK